MKISALVLHWVMNVKQARQTKTSKQSINQNKQKQANKQTIN